MIRIYPIGYPLFPSGFTPSKSVEADSHKAPSRHRSRGSGWGGMGSPAKEAQGAGVRVGWGHKLGRDWDGGDN